MDDDKRSELRNELSAVLNRFSMENGSNTPDFLLADYLCDCLATWESTVEKREKWYGRGPKGIATDLPHPASR